MTRIILALATLAMLSGCAGNMYGFEDTRDAPVPEVASARAAGGTGYGGN